MPRVNTNDVQIAYSIESALGVAGLNWREIEPNSIADFGATTTRVARNPISKDRQRRKGTITDLDSAVGIETDLTLDAFRDFIEAFCFATGVNTDVTGIPVTNTTAGNYQVAALVAAQAAKLNSNTLLWAAGFSVAGTNGLKLLAANVAAAAVLIPIAGVAAGGGAGRISLCGYRIPAATAASWTWAAATKRATLASAAVGTQAQARGLEIGQLVHIGSVLSPMNLALTNGFQNATANDMVGYARVRTISADEIVFDKVDAALRFTDAAIATAVDIIFGQFVRNRATDHAGYLSRSFQFEALFKGLGAGPSDRYQYALGNFCNTVGFALPLTNKATATFAFIGTDTENPVAAANRKMGAVNAVTPSERTAFNTSNDFARLRITEVDEDGITTDFKSLTLNINNGISGEKVLNALGAKYINVGDFQIGLEAQLVFSDEAVIQKIRDNESVTMDFILKNSDGVISVDIPSMTLGGGGREFPRNESVLINTTCEADGDNFIDASIAVSIIPLPLP